MATYYVALNRPTVVAATPQEAAQKCMTDPLEADDKFYVREVDPAGSMNFVPGAATALGGAFPTPQYIFVGPNFTPVQAAMEQF